MSPDGTRAIGMISHVFPGLDLYDADHEQSLTMAGEELDELDHDLSDISDRAVQYLPP